MTDTLKRQQRAAARKAPVLLRRVVHSQYPNPCRFDGCKFPKHRPDGRHNKTLRAQFFARMGIAA